MWSRNILGVSDTTVTVRGPARVVSFNMSLRFGADINSTLEQIESSHSRPNDTAKEGNPSNQLSKFCPVGASCRQRHTNRACVHMSWVEIRSCSCMPLAYEAFSDNGG